MIESPPGKRLGKWARTAFLDDEGTIFAPAAIAGNELAVTLCAAQDGMPMLTDQGHAYVPTSWLAREYSGDIEATCRSIERRIRAGV